MALHSLMKPRAGVFGECPGVGERLVYDAGTRAVRCTCNFPHGCPKYGSVADSKVIDATQPVDPNTTVIVFVVLAFVLVFFLVAHHLYTASVAPKSVETVGY